jgi:glucose-6-phosphate-specific signal transduction histidine kinase
MEITRHLMRASLRSWTSADLQRVGPYWMQWLWTLLFAAALAGAFTVLGFFTYAPQRMGLGSPAGWAYWYGKNLVVCLVISALIHLMFDAAGALVGGPSGMRRMSTTQRGLFFTGIPALGVLIGWPLGIWVSGSAQWVFPLLDHPRTLVATITLALLTSVVLQVLFAAKARQIHAEARALEAQLKLLQAQIEPHFLFNTLANVLSLMDHDPSKARRMLASFTDYLRASFTALRRADGAVADELELARSYLDLMQARMEERLRFRIEADEAARQQPLPPLLLQPLVENAVVHGLEPSIEGGCVTVSARVAGQRLVLEVQDDGAGTTPHGAASRPGNGLALDNIRQRLQARYGDEATLSVAPALAGTLARIELPLRTPAA